MKKYGLLCLMLVCLTLSAWGQKKSRQVQKLEKERAEALKAVERTERELNKTRKDARNVSKQVGLLQTQVKQRRKVIDLLSAELQVLDAETDSLRSNITSLRKQEEMRKGDYAKAVQAMQRRQSSLDRILFLFSARDFNEGTRRMMYMSQYARAHKEAAAELRNVREQIEEKRAALENTRADKRSVLSMKEDEKKKLQKEEQALNKEAVALKKKTSNLQQQLSKQQARADALNKKIEQQIAYEIAEAERKAREAQERAEREREAGRKVPKMEERRAVTKGGYAMDAAELKLSNSFSGNMGKLPAPVRGRYTIEVPYGKSRDKHNARITRDNGGVDLAVSAGSDAYAVFDGIVSLVFVQPGYNTAVIVRHGNYLTVYANLSSVYIKKGDKVRTGQKIGRIFTDHSSGKSILHFELWRERNKQNPMSWIR
ncbi:peptidase M24 [Porphyromonas crevioricanis]|uniref:murein hydrolase activator EnvC family protein n=1 Tax=Porphyromonas crevioricanis TaxID=393921 RepID=UPI00052C0BC6|nr:peptidoglycan DD-metalloendopeptidase family protein [Porphyromonas crevioricanis]KGN91219.1 peptidase M24 [Porphyromonas crevioricanis]